jgi:hypothetical protein
MLDKSLSENINFSNFTTIVVRDFLTTECLDRLPGYGVGYCLLNYDQCEFF